MPPALGNLQGEIAEFRISGNPDRMIMVISKLSGPRARRIANDAVREARKLMPKMSGRAASRLFPIYGYGYFGIGWLDCLIPGTRVLRDDWRWVPVEELRVGDSLISFDEEIISSDPAMRGRGRRYRTGRVEACEVASRECVVVTFDDGTQITCTRNHPWLTLRHDGQARKWINSGHLRAGDKIGVYLKPWEEDRSYDAGWLSGIYDGEGSFVFNNWKGHEDWTNSGSLVLTQNSGPVLDHAVRLLEERGFEYRLQSRSEDDVKNVCLKGGFAEQARLIGSVRPGRLLPKLRYENRYMRAVFDRTVVAVQEIGYQDVVLLSTSARTYLAEGMPSHNSYTWFQEQGIRPFTMRSLAGKTIPMWIDDPGGIERQRNPKARVRTTMSGKTQVLIFRRAALPGQTKQVRTRVAGQWETKTVPMSYPGAPGRIGRREIGQPLTTPGKTGGRIAGGNVGVRWRHPGLAPRKFLNRGMSLAAQRNGILPVRVYVADRMWRSHF